MAVLDIIMPAEHCLMWQPERQSEGSKFIVLHAMSGVFSKFCLCAGEPSYEPVQICLDMSMETDFTPQALRNLVWRLRVKIGSEAVFSSRYMGYMLR